MTQASLETYDDQKSSGALKSNYQKVKDFINDQPGCHKYQLMELLGMTHQTLTSQLTALQIEGWIREGDEKVLAVRNGRKAKVTAWYPVSRWEKHFYSTLYANKRFKRGVSFIIDNFPDRIDEAMDLLQTFKKEQS